MNTPDEFNPETVAPEAQAAERETDAKKKIPADLIPQMVKRVHELYEEIGRADVRAIQEWERLSGRFKNLEPKPMCLKRKQLSRSLN